MGNTRALLLNNGMLASKADAAMARYKVACVGSDADHVKYAAAVTDRPRGILVDGCDAAEELVAFSSWGVPAIVKMSGAGGAGAYICPAVDGSGDARVVPATAGAYFAFGRLIQAAEDDEEAVIETFSPMLVGAQHANGQLSIPSFAADPTTPIANQMWVNSTDNSLNVYINGAKRTLTFIALALAFCLLGSLLSAPAAAADKTPMVQTSATTGGTAAAASGDNVKIPTGATFEVVGTSTFTGAATFTSAPVFTDASGSRTALGLAIGTNVQAYDADLTTYAGITPSANIQSLLGSADYATARTNLGLAIGTDVQAYDADLTTFAGISPTANVVTFLGAADNAAMAAIIAGAVVEGGLANSTIVTADIKDGEIVDADVNASAAIANTKLGLPAVRTISQAVTVAEFTDNTNATGYIDLSTQIPANSVVLGWKANVTSGFAGDTTAVIELGRTGALTDFSADTAQSVLGVGKVGSASVAATSYTTAATTVRVTVTGGADFTTIKTANTAAATITVYYLQTE